jgi:hypothetical protein
MTKTTAAATAVLVLYTAEGWAQEISDPRRGANPGASTTDVSSPGQVRSDAPSPMASPPLGKPPASPELTSGFGAFVGSGFAFLSMPPDMNLVTPDGGAMSQFAKTPVAHLGAMQMIDIDVAVFFRTASPITLPLLGFEFGIPVSTGYPGSVALETKPSLSWIRGGPTFYDGMDISGVGVEFAAGTFRFGFTVFPGFRYVRTTGTTTLGLLTVDAEAHEYSFSLHADAMACAGAKAAVSVCLFAAPHVFEFSRALNGAAFGVRVETN